MKLAHGITALSIAAMLALSGAAFAAEATSTTTNTAPAEDPTKDTGMASLGVDVSGGGATPESAKAFVATLSAGQATGVMNGCKDVQKNAATMNATVVTFCNNLIGVAN